MALDKRIFLVLLVILVLLLRNQHADEIDADTLQRRKRRRVYEEVQRKKRVIAAAYLTNKSRNQRLPGAGRGYGRRRLWAIPRQHDRYDDFLGIYAVLGVQWPDLENSEYLALFRLSKETFTMLYGLLRHRIRRQDTAMRRAIPARKRLMLTLHWLATGVRFKDLADSWAIGKSTAQLIVHQVVYTLLQTIVKPSIGFPEGDELIRVMEDFESLSRLPQCAGAIDGCFIPIVWPEGEFAHKYWCYKGMDAIILLAVVDARGVFTYVHAGMPGSVGDAGTYMDTVLNGNITAGRYLPEREARYIRGVYIRPYIVADAAFPFSATMMKNFPGNPQRGTLQHAYTWAHVRTRRVIENAFGSQVLRSSQMNDPAFHTCVILVCCALHIICERHRDPFETDRFPEPDGKAADPNIGGGMQAEHRAANVRLALAQEVRDAGDF